MLLYLIIKAVNLIVGTDALNFPWGKESTVFTVFVCSCYMFIYIEFPREEICALSVGVISAFCVWEPVCYGDEIVPAAATTAQPPPQP